MIDFLQDHLMSFGIIDAIDILVVAFLIYRVLVILKGTRALRVLGGLLVLVALYALARLLSLSTVYWVLENISLYLVLAVVVLFQEDIRRGLARVGNPLFGGRRSQEEVSSYQEIAKACFRLAGQGHGALIAVEREASLLDLEEQATPLDARLTEELLVAVFQPTSPIHDGAVLVRKDRVVVAGSFLPLSRRNDLPARMGTRHRAALGQVEDTDCMVFVVSEERRAVSIAFRGELVPVDSPDQLRLKVQELLALEASNSEEPAPGRTGGLAPTRPANSGSFPPAGGPDRTR